MSQSEVHPTDLSHIEFYQGLAHILEEMFPPGWFQRTDNRTRHHPAYAQWSLCQKILAQRGTFHSAEQWDDIPRVAKLMLDTLCFVMLTGGDLDRLHIGPFEQIGDETVQRKIRSRIQDPRQYLDLLPELYIHAWHKQEGHRVEAMEREGWPDLRVDIPRENVPFLIECKRIQTITRTRFDTDVKKANKQIEQGKRGLTGPSSGIAVLDISTPCTLEWEKGEDDPNEPKVPASALRAAHLAIMGKNTAIDHLLLIWNDFTRWGTPPNPTFCSLRRHVEYIHRPNSSPTLPETFPSLFKGHTVVFWLRWQPTRQWFYTGHQALQNAPSHMEDSPAHQEEEMSMTASHSTNNSKVYLNAFFVCERIDSAPNGNILSPV